MNGFTYLLNTFMVDNDLLSNVLEDGASTRPIINKDII